MTPEERKQLIDDVCIGVTCALESRLPNQLHNKHHDFLELEIQRREKRAQTWENIKKTAIGMITVAVLSLIGSGLLWIGNLVLEAWKKTP